MSSCQHHHNHCYHQLTIPITTTSTLTLAISTSPPIAPLRSSPSPYSPDQHYNHRRQHHLNDHHIFIGIAATLTILELSPTPPVLVLPSQPSSLSSPPSLSPPSPLQSSRFRGLHRHSYHRCRTYHHQY